VAYAEYTHMCVLYRGYVGGIYAEGGKDEDDEGQVGVSCDSECHLWCRVAD